MDVDDPNDAEALRRKLQKLDDERNRVEARISQQRRGAGRRREASRRENTSHNDGERSTTGRGAAPTCNDERAPTKGIKEALETDTPEADAVARSASCRRMHRRRHATLKRRPGARRPPRERGKILKGRDQIATARGGYRTQDQARGDAEARISSGRGHRMCEAKYKDQARRDEISRTCGGRRLLAPCVESV